jgi:hypothetical protein
MENGWCRFQQQTHGVDLVLVHRGFSISLCPPFVSPTHPTARGAGGGGFCNFVCPGEPELLRPRNVSAAKSFQQKGVEMSHVLPYERT